MDDLDISNSKVTQYLIPANVTVRFELWEGFGWRELKYCVMALLLGGLMYLISGSFYKTELYDIKDLPFEKTLGLKNDDFTSIDGDIVTMKTRVVPDGLRYLLLVSPAALTYFCVKRDRSTGMSLIDNVVHMKEFNKSQKLYLYKYGSGMEGK